MIYLHYLSMFKPVILLLLLFWQTINVSAQVCSAPTQTPVSAMFICGSEAFYLTTGQFCGQNDIPVPCGSGPLYQDKNPNFFRFACYQTGTLGFTINPDEATADYSWQLFDITSVNPVDVFTNFNLFVDCNWSTEPGSTGADGNGATDRVCSGPGLPLFNKMPTVTAGRTYLLMVTNQSASTGGYQLLVGGGSAIITDAIDPHLRAVSANCDGTELFVQMNKQVNCTSVAGDGSDFTLSAPGINIISANPIDCRYPFGSDLVRIVLDQTLPFGNYTLTIKDGSDGNPLFDICNRDIPPGESIPVVFAPSQPTPMDSVSTVACTPDHIQLVFKQPMNCSSIATDGSDFVITGPQTVTVTPVLSCGTTNKTTILRLNLSPALTQGNYTIQLVSGSDGNTIINECGVPTPAGAILPFTISEPVSALFTTSSDLCKGSLVQFHHDGANNVNSWNWDFGNGETSTSQHPVINFTPGNYAVKLKVSNNQCSDTKTQNFTINKDFEAAFTVPAMLCPNDTLPVQNLSSNQADKWDWTFGDGGTSILQKPVGHRYPNTGVESQYIIRLIAESTVGGCKDTATQAIKVLPNCIIAVPSAFTPNGDGINDFLYPLNALKAKQMEFRVYNRSGQQVFFTRDWTRKWDGRINGVPQPTGVYAWLLSFTDADTNNKVLMKGTVLLLR